VPQVDPTKRADPPEPATTAQENIQVVAQIESRAARRRTLTQRATDRLLRIAGREVTVLVHAAIFALWLVINSGLMLVRPFDPFPFTLLTMVVSLEAIFLSLLVLSSQNRLTQDADRRAQLDLQVNLLAEQEMTVVLQMLEEICDHLGLRKTLASTKFQELAQRTDVGQLAEHLERTIGVEASPTTRGD
jgi:uncharacterized membrane protein